MRDDLLTYYERELTFVRRLSAEFAEKYPRVAGRLLLEPGKCEDPHVERLIESFALMAARIHLRLDDEFPEIAESLLQVLYPHYLCPIPSMAIVRFDLDPTQGKISTGYAIPRHQTLYAKPAADTVCRFRTCYPVTLWPVDTASVRVQSGGGFSVGDQPSDLVVALRTQGDATFADLEIDTLRFFLGGETRVAHQLYELLFSRCRRVELRTPDGAKRPASVHLPEGSLGEVGFGRDEGMLPFSQRSFVGYRLLLEYFHFPEKYLFVDVKNLGALRQAGFERDVEIVFHLDKTPRFDQEIDAHQFQLGCTPAINLYRKMAEPIRLDHAHTEYRIVPDLRQQRTTEVHSIDTVTSISPTSGATLEFHPFYSFKHSFERKSQHAFWHAMRRPSTRKDDAGTEVYLSLVDLDFRPVRPPTDVVTVQGTFTNRDLPGQLPFGNAAGDFNLEGAAPVKAVRCRTKPTRTGRLGLGQGMQWRLISHLSLNYLSPVEWGGDTGPEVLQELLKLYDFSDSAVVQQQISGIKTVSSRQVMRRIRSAEGSGFARGVEATIEFDESKFVGSGAYLFASVLEKFLGLYVSINSFSELAAVSTQRGPFYRWPPRTGFQPLL